MSSSVKIDVVHSTAGRPLLTRELLHLKEKCIDLLKFKKAKNLNLMMSHSFFAMYAKCTHVT